MQHVYLQGDAYVVYDGGTFGSYLVFLWQSSLRQLSLVELLVVFKIMVEALRKKQPHNHLAIRLPMVSCHYCESTYLELIWRMADDVENADPATCR